MDNELVELIFSGDNIIFVTGGTIAIVAILFSAVKSMVITSHREKSRREIAAYIAEGSMTPEDGMELLQAGAKDDRKCGL